VVKYYIDAGHLHKAVATATESTTVGLVKTPERFPGRKGSGRDVVRRGSPRRTASDMSLGLISSMGLCIR